MANYLYNGVELPELPVVDGYPYALIRQQNADIADSNYYFLNLSTKEYFVNGTQGTSAGSVRLYRCLVNGGTEWEYLREENPSYWLAGPFGTAIWTSHKIYNEDGTLYLAASDPVPVSPVKLNPALLVQSFFTGQAIRRGRK